MLKRPTTVRPIGVPEPLRLELPADFADYFVLSPYVTRALHGYEMLVRLVNRDDDPSKKISRIHAARSADGLTFSVDAQAIISPGAPGEDDDRGCEDPTIANGGGRNVVFYSGYGGTQKRSTMLRASGDGLSRLVKHGQAFDDRRFENPKEASLISTPDGFRMYFEYAIDGASRIGTADAQLLDGPWRFATSVLPERPGVFDSWHLSPASAVRLSNAEHVLFYNGSTKEAAWRIGWARLSPDARILMDRCDEALIGTFDLRPGDTDIAFAASTVLELPDVVSVYYSISDRRLLRQRVFVEGAVADSAAAASS